MLNPKIGDTQLAMLFAGPADKKDVAAQVVADVGFIPKHVGPIRYARNLEVRIAGWLGGGHALGACRWHCWAAGWGPLADRAQQGCTPDSQRPVHVVVS